jgi:3-hydroxybutyryl-CoA dehydrogenase
MKLADIKAVDSMTIWGLGTMGRTWALAGLLGKFKVYAHEPFESTKEDALKFIEKTLQKIEAKKEAEGLAKEGMGNLSIVDAKEAIVTGTPIHLEVIPESLSGKIDFFREIGPKFPEDTVLWTNTSCLNVEKIGVASGRPEFFVGTHGMNPVHLMPGVEVVRTDLVDDKVFSWTMKVLEKLGKIPFPARNVPGFIVNKLYVPLALDTIRLLFRGEADTQTIDQALKLSLGHPQGGLILADRIGHDVMIDVSNELYNATQDPRFVVPPEYLKMREVGNIGFKSGQGFYRWREDPRNPSPVPVDELTEPASS